MPTSGDDSIIGTAAADSITGFSGDDTLFGRGGDDTLRGGTGELRAWVSAAGACQWPASVIDYMPIHHVKTGVGFACWPPRAA